MRAEEKELKNEMEQMVCTSNYGERFIERRKKEIKKKQEEFETIEEK